MTSVLRYGLDHSLALDLPSDVLLSACAGQGRASLVDPLRAMAAALDQPIEFPPLHKATVPGDHILVAVSPGVPQAAVIVAGVIRHLVEQGTDAGDIQVMAAAAGRNGDDLLRQVPGVWRSDIATLVHDPNDKRQLGLLATSRFGRAIMVNRAILDADLVVPIGCLRCEGAPGYYGLYAGLFPTFSDIATVERFSRSGSGPRTAQLSDEAAEAGWLLGIHFTVQVVPGESGGVLEVLAGEASQVYKSGQRQCRQAWSCQVPRRASLVVAAVSGEAAEQTWENVARAASAASRAVVEGGAIALCTDLVAEPPAAVERLAETDDLDAALKQLRREKQGDSMAAEALALARQHARLYLLSGLDDSVVEQLGMAPVSQAEEIMRLARRHDTCILLPDAQHVVATPIEES